LAGREEILEEFRYMKLTGFSERNTYNNTCTTLDMHNWI
jgi:hypothetical protein